MTLNLHQIAALGVPPTLIIFMFWLFQAFHRRFGYPRGYLLGFALYWIGWCLLIPALLLGGLGSLISLLSPIPPLTALDWKINLLLWWPIIFPLIFVFVPRIEKANLAILSASIGLGVIIGVTEEVLWRGVYMRLFPDNPWLNLVYPTLMFALWHICPQAILPNKLPGGMFSFVAYAFFLGLTYALAVYLTGSIAWSTVAHIVHDTLGLGGFAYAAWLTPHAIARQHNQPETERN